MPEQPSNEFHDVFQCQQKDGPYMPSNSYSSLAYSKSSLSSGTLDRNFKKINCQPLDQTKNYGFGNFMTKSALHSSQDCVNIDSGTDADDENVIKGFIVPKLQHIRSRGGRKFWDPSLTKSPFYTIGKSRKKKILWIIQQHETNCTNQKLETMTKPHPKLNSEYIRRITEFGLMAFVSGLICTDPEIRNLLDFWKKELLFQSLVTFGLCTFYLFRTLYYFEPLLCAGSKFLAIHPMCEDASLIYPPYISILVSLIQFKKKPYEFLPSIVLGIASLPSCLIPSFNIFENLDATHWMLSLVPLIFKKPYFKNEDLFPEIHRPDFESLALLFPLHHFLCSTLSCVINNSLLPAELQLFSLSLINLLLHSNSPQAIVLKSLLWGGGIGILVSCGRVLETIRALSKTPKWRFRRINNSPTLHERFYKLFKGCFGPFIIGRWLIANKSDSLDSKEMDYSSEFPASYFISRPRSKSLKSRRTEKEMSFKRKLWPKSDLSNRFSASNRGKPSEFKRHRSWSSTRFSLGSNRLLVSVRRKRRDALKEKLLASLSLQQAMFRKKLYVGYVYFCILGIILVGIRKYIETFAFFGNEPLGWALGYFFGDIQNFRLLITNRRLQRWIRLKPQYDMQNDQSCFEGWVELWRRYYIGEANTRLILCAYWVVIMILGLWVVIRLTSYLEVDTRRKLFHFMMVAILLPATYVDPTFTSFALSLILALFLLLELLRATYVPPFSKFLTHFLAPFVDGRDLKGPVVISHIFLLIGCSIPLWLTLGLIPRVEGTIFNAWDVNYREVSMVSGVICVGMGDSAASLIGRRFGHHKWPWQGSKTLEGSAAFAVTVGIGLVIAKAWLRIGGWLANNDDIFIMTLWKSGIAACAASLTEAALIGGNDNVIVPIILWLCVKGLDL